MVEETEEKKALLRDYKGQKPAKTGWISKHLPFLLRWDSLFYFGIFLFLLSSLWTIYTLATNSWTQLLNWDYTWQYISFTYDYWDAWHLFFTTAKFPMYDPGVFMGTDMIGSGSYYGLFDPFMFICYIFPRDWIPQMYAQMTFVKLTCGALFMRMYLKKMGIREWTARFGCVIYAFSGYTTFFMGSPNFTSAMAFFPLILFGIERVLKDRKIIALSVGIGLLGVSCFFYVPVICIYGVIYAVWRFFLTFKERTKVQQFTTMGLGILGFACGLMISAFSLIPSLRETFLSGRGSSIGSAYLKLMLESFKSADAKMFFGLIFEEVGDAPGRELMGLLSFFFPTAGFTNLPFARAFDGQSIGYDAWTSSLFCYTPCVILFFAGLIHSIRLKKWHHLLAILLCVFAVFTNFSYFFFYAFSGNGYGRWFLVLVPLIVYYCCWAFDQRKEGPKFVPFASSILALIGTIIAYYAADKTLNGVEFSSYIYNVHNTTYWISRYVTASQEFKTISTCWFFYYQLGFVILEGFLFCIGNRKRWLPGAIFGLVCVEVVVMGNVSYVFNGTWSYQYSYARGASNREVSLVMANNIKDGDKSFYRTFSDTYYGSNYTHNYMGTYTLASFHSLMNFDVEDFALINQIKFPGSPRTTYGDEKYYNPNWSGYYMNKRYVTDTVLGYRYYIVKNDYSAWKDGEGNPLFLQPNVPFDSVEHADYSPNRDIYRVYERSRESLTELGYAVDSDLLYRIGHKEDSYYKNAFFDYYRDIGSSRQLVWAEHVELNGAIIGDDDVLPEKFIIREANDAPNPTSDAQLEVYTGKRILRINAGLKAEYYETKPADGLLASTSEDYYDEGPGYFLNHYESKVNVTSLVSVQKDFGKLAFRPDYGTYFNEDPNGCYLQFRFYNERKLGAPRVYAIGDKFDTNGNLVAENACLSFDNYLLPNAKENNNYCAESSTFGLYAYGRVKYLVFCFSGSGSVPIGTSNVYITMTEREDIENLEALHKQKSLQNVQKDVNSFTFETNFEEDSIVVTQLGYDKGWEAIATMPNGSHKSCQMLKLDGGLVGFVAPGLTDDNGNPLKITYVLNYRTPYSAISITASSVGVVTVVLVTLGQFFWAKRKKKKEEETSQVQA